RVIAAIFQPPQSLDDDRDGLLIADVSNNSAHEISSENRFVVPPSGRKGRLQIHSAMPGACGLKAGLRTALFLIYWRCRRDMNDSCKSGVFDYRSSRVVCSVTSTISGSAFTRGDWGIVWLRGEFISSSSLRFCSSSASSARNWRSRMFLKNPLEMRLKTPAAPSASETDKKVNSIVRPALYPLPSRSDSLIEPKTIRKIIRSNAVNIIRATPAISRLSRRHCS